MNRVIHKDRRQFYSAIVGLIFFSFVMIGTMVFAWGDAIALPIALFWAGWLLLSLWMLFDHWRYRLTLSADHVRIDNVFRTRECALAEVTNMRWRIFPGNGGSVVLRTVSCKLAIGFDEFGDEHRFELIRYIRTAVPAGLQSNWATFCARTAMPLRRRIENDPLQPGEYLQTRRQVDRFFIWILAIVVIFCLVMLWIWIAFLGDSNRGLGALLGITLPLVLWPILRYSIPATGSPVRKNRMFQPKYAVMGSSAFMLMSCGMVAIAYPFVETIRFPKSLVCAGVLFALAGAFFLIRSGRREKTLQNNVAEQEASEWDRREVAI